MTLIGTMSRPRLAETNPDSQSIHIWPDPDLLSLVDDSTKAWLLAWFHRHPPEAFAGRPAPTFEPPEPPISQPNLSDF